MHYEQKTLPEWQTRFITAANNIFDNKYDYSQVCYSSTHVPVTIICPDHGPFLKRPVKHISAKEGCPTCAKQARLQNSVRFKNIDDIREECNTLHNSAYLYTDVSLSPRGYITTDSLLTIVCPTHGEFTQTVNKHIYQKTKCEKCKFVTNAALKIQRTKLIFEQERILIHGNKYDYSKVDYKGWHPKVTITCPIHGDFEMSPTNHIRGYQGCPTCCESGPEQIIRQLLTDRHIKFIAQKKFPGCIGADTKSALRYDFYLPTQNTVIEYDGIYHYQAIQHGDGAESAALRFSRQQQNDLIKTKYAEDHNMTLIRIPHFEKQTIVTIIDSIATQVIA